VTEAVARQEKRWPGETLRATSVSRSFEGVDALREVTLELHRHEIVGLIGPNGAGKTTLVNIMSGFDFPTAGTVEFQGRDVTRWRPNRRGRAGLARTFQHSRSF
jgi:branched-chain amino acid transport system ATP-binding protein